MLQASGLAEIQIISSYIILALDEYIKTVHLVYLTLNLIRVFSTVSICICRACTTEKLGIASNTVFNL